MLANDGAAAQADGNDVGHAEVGAHAADGHGNAALAREAGLQNAQVGGGAAHVNDDGVVHAAQVACAANGVRGAACDGENRVTASVIDGHERAVVLGQIHVGLGNATLGQALRKALGEALGNQVERRVQNGGVLALDQTHRADLARDGNAYIVAEHLAGDGGSSELVIVAHASEHAANGDRVDLALHTLEEGAARSLVEVGQTLAVEFEAAANNGGINGNRRNIVGPVDHGGNAHGSRRANTQNGDGGQALALDDGVGALRGAEHSLLNEFAINVRLGEHGVNRAHDALVDIARGGVLHRGDNLQVLVDQNGVGVGAADINAKFIHISSTFFKLHSTLLPGRPSRRACSRSAELLPLALLAMRRSSHFQF